MPKMKTHSGCKKRFRRTGAGLIKRTAAYRRHHAWSRSAGQTMGLRGIKYVAGADVARLAVLLPN